MRRNGNITLVGEIRGFKPERRIDDPAAIDLREGLLWFNLTENCYKYFDGSQINRLAVGDDLSKYLPLAGGKLTGGLSLAGDAEEADQATTLRQVEEGLGTKQNTVEGAASTVVAENLNSDKVVVSSSTGKIVASDIEVNELNQLDGINANIQEQLDSKQGNIGYVPVNQAGDTMEGDLHFDGAHTVTDLRKPVEPTDAVRLIDIENMKADLDFQADVLAVQRDGTLTDEDFTVPLAEVRFIVTDIATLDPSFGVIDGLVENDIIAKFATDTGHEYRVVYAVSEKGPGVLVWARDIGRWMKFDGTSWTEHGGLSGVTPSQGLGKEDNTLFIKYGAGSKLSATGKVSTAHRASSPIQTVLNGEISGGDEAEIDLLHTSQLEVIDNKLGLAEQSVNARELHTDVAGDGLTGGDGAALRVVTDDDTLVIEDNAVKLGDVSDRYLKFDVGGTLAAPLNVMTPTAAANPTPKRYVDSGLADLLGQLNAHATRFEQSQFVLDARSHDPQAAFAVVHNFGNIGVTVVVYDENLKQIIPDEVELINENRVDVRLADEQRVLIVVQGLKAFVEPGPTPEGDVTDVTLPSAGEVVLAEGESYKSSIVVEGWGASYLEVDINVTDPQAPIQARQQFTLAANELDPYDGNEADFTALGINVTYSEAEQRWDIDYGQAATAAMVASGQIRFYFAVLDANKLNLWGDMNNTTPEMRVFVNLSRE